MRILAVLVFVVVVFSIGTAPAVAATRYLDEVFPTVTQTLNVPYGQAINEQGQMETLLLDLYQPAGDTLEARPVFIWVHGGGFISGNKTEGTNIANAFARRGYVTASISYRLREGAVFSGPTDPAFIQAALDAQHDAQAAVRWFRANAATYRIDASRIAMGGYSAGSVTALLVAYHSDDVGNSGNPGYPSTISAAISFAGGTNVLLMDPGEPPVMLVHGTADTTAPYQGSLDIVARANELGIYAELHPLQGQGHLAFFQYWDETVEWGDDFLYQQMIDPLGACIYDIDGSGDVGFADLLTLAQAYNSSSGGTGWNAAADFNSDGSVSFRDLLLLAAHYGWSTAPCP